MSCKSQHSYYSKALTSVKMYLYKATDSHEILYGAVGG